jgi:hypothetical protein
VLRIGIDNSSKDCFVALSEAFRSLVEFLNLEFDASYGEIKSGLEWTWRFHCVLYAVREWLIVFPGFPFFRESF